MNQRLRLPCALLGITALSVLAAGCGGGGKKSSKPHVPTQTELVSRVSKSTVEITGRLGTYSQVSGTGVVIDADKGLVLTNAHVIAGVSSVKVRYKDQTTPAQIVGQAPCDDLAVLRLVDKPTGIETLPFARTAQNVLAGQRVTALGYPESAQSNPNPKLTATDGTVSVDGTITATVGDDLPEYLSVIQHQAVINPGNSGGPLVDRFGRLLGINTLGTSGKLEPQNYAISIDHIRVLLSRLEAGKNVAYVGWALLPVTYLNGQDITTLGWRYKSGGVGMAIIGIDAGSAADARHFQFSDYIEDINNTQVNTMKDVCDILQSNEGHVVKVKGYDLINNGTSYIEKVRVQ